MNFIIPQHLIDATKCDREFLCIFGDASKICLVEESIGDILFMERKNLEHCRHKIKLNGIHNCKCEVRKSIFKNYGV